MNTVRTKSIIAILVLAITAGICYPSFAATDAAESKTKVSRHSPSAVAGVTDSTFERQVLNARGLVLVDFYSPWCLTCKVEAPLIESLAHELGNQVKFCAVDITQNPQLASRYPARVLPSFRLFEQGDVVWTESGSVRETDLRADLDRFD